MALLPPTQKLSRQQTKERYVLGRQLMKSLSQAARPTRWKFAQHSLFREFSGWFVSVMPLVAVNQFQTEFRFYFKPMSIDPVFWEIVDLPDNVRLPLSFRARGAWTCHTVPSVTSIRSDVDQTPETLASLLVTWADEQVGRLASTWTLDGFLDELKTRKHPWEFATLVSALIAAGRDEEALLACRSQRFGGGFAVGSSSFVTLAQAFIRGKGVAIDLPEAE